MGRGVRRPNQNVAVSVLQYIHYPFAVAIFKLLPSSRHSKVDKGGACGRFAAAMATVDMGALS